MHRLLEVQRLESTDPRGCELAQGDTRCGPAPDWCGAVLHYWLAKRRGERTMREARHRRTEATEATVNPRTAGAWRVGRRYGHTAQPQDL
jgi:hypothetical protein